jgi:hypothetical protein
MFTFAVQRNDLEFERNPKNKIKSCLELEVRMEVPNKPLIEPLATVINGHTFTVDKRYVLKDSRILGKGSFGVVCTAYDSVRKIDMAIKRIRPYANDDWDSRHTLREIRLLKLLGPHPNVIYFLFVNPLSFF